MLMVWGTWRSSVVTTQVSLYLKRTSRPPKFPDMLLHWAISTTCWVISALTSKHRGLHRVSFKFRGQKVFQRGTRHQGLRFGTGTSRNSGAPWESLNTTSAVFVYSAKVRASCPWKLLHGQFQKWGLHTSPPKASNRSTPKARHKLLESCMWEGPPDNHTVLLTRYFMEFHVSWAVVPGLFLFIRRQDCQGCVRTSLPLPA